MPSIIFRSNRNHIDIVAKGKLWPNMRELANMGITFTLTVFAWIFFRAENVGHAFSIIKEIFSPSLISNPVITMPEMKRAFLTIVWSFYL